MWRDRRAGATGKSRDGKAQNTKGKKKGERRVQVLGFSKKIGTKRDEGLGLEPKQI